MIRKYSDDDDDQGERDDTIEEKVEIWVKIGCALSFCICILHYLYYTHLMDILFCCVHKTQCNINFKNHILQSSKKAK